MPYLRTLIDNELGRINAMIPAGEDTKDYVSRNLDLQIDSLSNDTSMGIVSPSIPSMIQMLASARIAVEIIDQPEELVCKPEGIVDLGVIKWLLRPALPVRDGVLVPITSGPWANISANAVEKQEKLVCRLDIVLPGFASIQIGTGFVVGNDADNKAIVMTNAHVVEAALRLGWNKTQVVKFGCDFTRYSAEHQEELLIVTDDYCVHPKQDLALLFLKSDDLRGKMDPLILSEEAPDASVGMQIGVLGHPSFDSRLDVFPRYFGFGDEFGIKRFSPGEIRLVQSRDWRGFNVETILHDATTLSGSSGSCIFDLTNMKVVGLHFGGWPLPRRPIRIADADMLAQLFYENGAVPLWHLLGDPMLQNVNFQ